MQGYGVEKLKINFHWNKAIKHVSIQNICLQDFWELDFVVWSFGFKIIWKSYYLLPHRKQYIDLNFLRHFLSRMGLCEKAWTVIHLRVHLNSLLASIKVYFLESLLQSHDPSEIILIFWFAAQFCIISIMLKRAENICFSVLMNRKSRRTASLVLILIWILIIKH